MINTKEELFLTEYFLIRAVLGKYLEDSEKLFCALGKIFFISDERLHLLYCLSESEDVQDIKTDDDYKRCLRIKQLLQIRGVKNALDEDTESMIVIKGTAIRQAVELKLNVDGIVSRSEVYTILTNAVNQGIIPAIRIFGILQCEGIFINKNYKSGIVALSKSANWNDVTSIFALLKYCEDTREYNMSRLYMLVNNTPYNALYDTAVKYYGLDLAEEIEEVKLLERAFKSAAIKRDIHDSQYARIVYSEILRSDEKEKLVGGESRDIASIISYLPLSLLKCNLSLTDFSKLRQVILLREDEQEKIITNLKNIDLVGQDKYYPLALCAGSNYILNMYAEAISKMSNANVVQINVAQLTEYDLEPTLKHIFIRNINENKANFFILNFTGIIRIEITNYIKNFLKASNRAQFHLNNPNVTIDLRSIVLICICDNINGEVLSDCCEVIQMAEVSDEEMRKVVGNMLLSKRKLYGVSEIKLQKNLMDKLCGEKIETVDKMLDFAVRKHRGERGCVEISEDFYDIYQSENKINKKGLGFGGD